MFRGTRQRIADITEFESTVDFFWTWSALYLCREWSPTNAAPVCNITIGGTTSLTNILLLKNSSWWREWKRCWWQSSPSKICSLIILWKIITIAIVVWHFRGTSFIEISCLTSPRKVLDMTNHQNQMLTKYRINFMMRLISCTKRAKDDDCG